MNSSNGSFYNVTTTSNSVNINGPSLLFTSNTVNISWILVSSALVFVMIIGLGIYYGGYVQRKNILSIYFSMFLSMAVVTIQWFAIGYSLSFSTSGSIFIGNFDSSFLNGIDSKSVNPAAPNIPANVFMLYQSLFAGIAPCLFFGSIAERGTLTSFLIILPIWTTLVYDFAAYWTWNTNGFLSLLGALDFAGGGPVHITAGFSAIAYAIAVGPRTNVDFESLKPISLSDVYLGTGILWFGWMGFNGGSELASNSRSANAILLTNISAAAGGITWMFAEMIFERTKKISLNAFCSGVIAGLVAITPASGYVRATSGIAIGSIASVFCFFGSFIRRLTKYQYDDTCDVFAIHGIGAMVGSVLAGIFAEKSISNMSGSTDILGGFIDRNYSQIFCQLIAVIACAVWAFTVTFVLVKILDIIPFIQLRLSEAEQDLGADYVELGENAYGVDLKEEKGRFKSIADKIFRRSLKRYKSIH